MRKTLALFITVLLALTMTGCATAGQLKNDPGAQYLVENLNFRNNKPYAVRFVKTFLQVSDQKGVVYLLDDPRKNSTTTDLIVGFVSDRGNHYILHIPLLQAKLVEGTGDSGAVFSFKSYNETDDLQMNIDNVNMFKSFTLMLNAADYENFVS